MVCLCEGIELLAVSQSLAFVSHSIFKGKSNIQCLGYSLRQKCRGNTSLGTNKMSHFCNCHFNQGTDFLMMHTYLQILVILYESLVNQVSLVIMFIPLPFLSLNCSNRNQTLETAPISQTNTAYVTTKCTVKLSPQPLDSNICMGLVMRDFVSSYQYVIPDCTAALFINLYS